MRRLSIFLALVFLASFAASQRVPVPSDAPFVPPRRWALVVGAGKYKELGELQYAPADARAFSQTLIEDYRFDPDRVTLLTDDSPNAIPPTTGNVRTALSRLLDNKSLDKGDLFILYFSGHGVGLPTGDYLAPTDATKANVGEVGLPIREVVERIVKAGLRNVLVITDCCRSGKENDFGAELQELGRKANIAVLLATQPGKRSYEYPQLGHGVFAHFLLRALKDSSLRDPRSGALWASRVAEKVRDQVSSYTQRDYGDDAQRPAPWTEKTQDVLLGAFVPDNIDDAGIRAFKEQAQNLNQKDYAAAMCLYAAKLVDARRLVDAVEFLKAVDQLGDLTPYFRYVLADALDDMGRLAESARQFDRLVAMPQEPYWRNLAIIEHSSRTITETQRVSAALAIYDADPTWLTGYLAWSIIKLHGTKQQLGTFLAKFEQRLTDPRRRTFVQAERATLGGDWNGAIRLYQKTLATFGLAPSDEVVRFSLFPILSTLGRNEELKKLAGEGAKEAENAAFWHIILGQTAKREGNYGLMVEEFNTAAKADPSPDQLLLILLNAGMRSPLVADAVYAAAERYPYAWKALLAKSFAAGLRKNQGELFDLAAQTDKYADDELSVLFEAFRISDSMIREVFEAGSISGEAYANAQSGMFKELLPFRTRFGQDADVWFLFQSIGLSNERNAQVAEAFRQQLGGLAQTNKLDPSLRALYAVSELNAGNFETAEKLLEKSKLAPADIVDGGWFRALLLACEGRKKEAKAMLPSLAKPSDDVLPIAEALRSWLEGKPFPSGSTHPTAIAIQGLALAEHGNWAKAIPLLEQSRQSRAWAYTFVHGVALCRLADGYLRAKRRSDLDLLAYEVSLSQPGNSAFAHITYGGKPDLSRFVGEYACEIAVVDEDENVARGDLKFAVKPTGDYRGTLTLEGKPCAFQGTVDAWGNLEGKVLTQKGSWKVVSKLLPRSMVKTFKPTSERGQFFIAFAPDLTRRIIVTKPTVSTK